MEIPGHILVFFAILFFLFGSLIAAIIVNNDLIKLGDAICKEEYGGDYGGFYGNTLICEPEEIKDDYDGIQVKILEDD